MDALKKHIRHVCDEQFLVCAEEEENDMARSGSNQAGAGVSSDWSDKILQLYQITQLNHGQISICFFNVRLQAFGIVINYHQGFILFADLIITNLYHDKSITC